MAVFVLVAVAVIVPGAICARVLACFVVLMGIRTVVIASPATAVTVGVCGQYGETGDCQQDHPCQQDNRQSVFYAMHILPPFIELVYNMGSDRLMSSRLEFRADSVDYGITHFMGADDR
jgi:hypothetical protein